MKTTLKTQLQSSLVMIIVIVFGHGTISQAQQKQTKAVITRAIDLFDISILSPIGFEEFKVINKTSKIAYSVNRSKDNVDEFYFLNRVEPLIDITIFQEYINNTANGSFQGIRIYPGYSSDTLFLVVCQANLTDSIEENHLILRSNNYDSQYPLTNARVISDIAQKFVKDYADSVYVFFMRQNDFQITDIYKISRFFSKAEIEELIKDNTPNNDPGYKIGIEFGYVPAELSYNFRGRLFPETYSLEQMMGFTCTMFVMGPDGNRRINPLLRYGGQGVYNDRYLEVGHPCPPRCGTLHQ